MKHLDIKRAIVERNYTVKTFAEKLGMSVVNLRENIIKGNPTIKKLEQVANALNCDVTDLFYSSEDSLTTLDLSSQDSSSPTIKQPDTNSVIETITFCPHCGNRVRVGVMLLPE